MTSVPTRGRIVAVHPHTELYGSDRVFIDTVKALLYAGWSVEVHVNPGAELKRDLADLAVDMVELEFPVLRRTNLHLRAALSTVARLAIHVVSAFKAVRGADRVYISTIACPS